ncbi:hypothetical protein [Halobacillus litoralis]|nr:hypothetical protein [Halobacillus litoralis]
MKLLRKLNLGVAVVGLSAVFYHLFIDRLHIPAVSIYLFNVVMFFCLV